MEIRSRVIKTEPIPWQALKFLQSEDFKACSPGEKSKLRHSLLTNEFSQPFYVWESPENVLYCLDGFHRYGVLRELQQEGKPVPELLPGTFIYCADIKQAAHLVLQYSSIYAKVTVGGMIEFLESFELDFSEVDLTCDLPGIEPSTMLPGYSPPTHVNEDKPKISLQERFIVPPFSILDSRQGYWQDRKRKWHALGFDSQESREEIEIMAQSSQPPAIYALRNELREKSGRDPDWSEIIDEADRRGLHIYSGSSIFDPVLCEILYSWFCPISAVITDPFAGGSVRGIVAGILGHAYHGIDLRADQVEANRRQSLLQPSAIPPIWYTGDSRNLNTILPDEHKSDFVFSCPPYHDLEQYSTEESDLSNMPWEKFREVYHEIIAKAVSTLKDNRFACFVVGEIRDKKGAYRDFVGETIRAFKNAGMIYYNEIILLNTAGSLPIRVGRQFANSRKVGKTHQNVLVFYKGDQKAIKGNFPVIEMDMSSEVDIEGVEKL